VLEAPRVLIWASETRECVLDEEVVIERHDGDVLTYVEEIS
jgi:hypothetical protein